MLSLVELLAAVKCGELAYICCMSKDQFLATMRNFEGYSPDDLERVYNAACSCANPNQTPGGGGAPPTPSGDVCVDKLVAFACQPTILGTAKAAQLALDLALVTVGNLSAQGKVAIIASKMGVDLLMDGCQSKTLDKKAAETICGIFNRTKNWVNKLPALLVTLLQPLASLMTLGILDALQGCCDMQNAALITIAGIDLDTAFDSPALTS